MEPVDVTKGSFLIDGDGVVRDCDFPFAYLYGHEEPQQLIDTHIHKHIPSLLLPQPGAQQIDKEVRKQRATSRTKDSVPFPSTIKLKIHDPDFHQLYVERTHPTQLQNSKFLYKGLVWVFANVSGLVTIGTNGLISSCNSNFLRTFLGYSEKELLTKSITALIPRFYEQIELLHEGSMSLLSARSLSVHSVNSGNGVGYPEVDESYENLDKILLIDSSQSTISETPNTSQSASTLEDVDVSPPPPRVDVDSGVGSGDNNEHSSSSDGVATTTHLGLLTCKNDHFFTPPENDVVVEDLTEENEDHVFETLLVQSSLTTATTTTTNTATNETTEDVCKDEEVPTVTTPLLCVQTSTPRASKECKQSIMTDGKSRG